MVPTIELLLGFERLYVVGKTCLSGSSPLLRLANDIPGQIVYRLSTEFSWHLLHCCEFCKMLCLEHCPTEPGGVGVIVIYIIYLNK